MVDGGPEQGNQLRSVTASQPSVLSVVGLSHDGEQLILSDAAGARFRLAVDESLRAALRADRPHLERLRGAGALAPREIQQKVRSGATAEQIAADFDLDVDHVRRFEGPVLAEREFVAAQAQNARVGTAPDSPTLGELVPSRLATRGVDVTQVIWDAVRPLDADWQVTVTFEIGTHRSTARWAYDQHKRTLHALEDEARWLSETALPDSPIPLRSLDSGATRQAPAGKQPPQAPTAQAQPPLDSTEAILADLAQRRGARQPIEVEDDDWDEFDGTEVFGPQAAFDLGPAGAAQPTDHGTDAQVYSLAAGRKSDTARRNGAAVPHDQPDAAAPAGRSAEPAAPAADVKADSPTSATEAPEPAGSPEEEEPAKPSKPESARQAGRKGRATMPSWDEIVFGARPD